MPHKVENKTIYTRVSIWGDASKWDIIQAIQELQWINPEKGVPDVWVVAPEVVVPLADFETIVQKALPLFPPGFTGARSAIVASNTFQYEMIQLYREELTREVPYQVGLFMDETEAVQWAIGERATT